MAKNMKNIWEIISIFKKAAFLIHLGTALVVHSSLGYIAL